MDHNYSALKGVPFCISSRCRPPPVSVISAPPQLPPSCKNVTFDLQYEREVLKALEEARQEQARLVKRLNEWQAVQAATQKQAKPGASDPGAALSYLLRSEGLGPPAAKKPAVQVDDPFELVEMNTINEMEELGRLLEGMGMSANGPPRPPSSPAPSPIAPSSPLPAAPSLGSMNSDLEGRISGSIPSYALPPGLDGADGPSPAMLHKYATIGVPSLRNPTPRAPVQNIPATAWTSIRSGPTSVQIQTRPQPPSTFYLESEWGADRQAQVRRQEEIRKEGEEEERRQAEETKMRMHRSSIKSASTVLDDPPSRHANNPQYQRLTAMGFPRDRVEQAIDTCKEEDSKMVEFIINLGTLCDEGVAATVAGDALAFMGNDMEKARSYVQSFKQLHELGFQGDKIKEAILVCGGKMEMAVEYLMQHAAADK